MKVNEIIVEAKLVEAIPLLTIPVILFALNGFFKAKSVYDIYTLLNEKGLDPDKLTEDDLINLAIDIILLMVPLPKKMTSEAIKSMMPDSVKRYLASTVRNKLAPLKQQLRKEFEAANKLRGAGSQEAARVAAREKFKAEAAKLANAKLKGPLYTIVGGIASIPLVYEYFEQILDIEDQYQKVLKGDTTTTRYGTASPQEAYATAKEMRESALGKLVIGVTAGIAGLPAAKGAKVLSDMIGKVSPRGSLVGGLLKLPFDLAAKIFKLGPAIPIILQTELGKKFLASAIVDSIVSGVGKLSSATLESLIGAVDWAAKQAGVDAKPVTDLARSKITPPPGGDDASTADAQDADTQTGPKGLRVQKDPTNPKIIYIGGQQITDKDGDQVASDSTMDNIRSAARGANLPDPTAGIKKNPAKPVNP